MNRHAVSASILLLAPAILVGCSSKKPPVSTPLPPGGVWSTILFSDEEARQPIVTSHVWMGDEVLFLVVPNFKRAGGGGGTHRSDELRFHGDMVLPEGKTELTYQAESVNGVVTTVTIADQTFELKDGRIFFVSANGPVGVAQLDYDPRGLPTQPKHNSEDTETYESFLKGISEFREFLPDQAKLP